MMGVRQIAEYLSRGIVLRRNLPPSSGGGILFVSPENGGLRFWRRNLGLIDPPLLAMVGRFVSAGMKVWDIGANVGLFTFSAAHAAGSGGLVVAVEADIDNVRLLQRSVRHMRRSENASVEVLPVAINRPGERFAKFQIARRSRSSNALAGFGLSQSGGFVEVRSVPCVTLDQLLENFGTPGLIKMDVEGAEYQALLGAERVLREARPVFLMEVGGDSEHGQPMADLLRSNSYKLFDADAPEENRAETALPAWNCLAIPSESVK